MTTFLRLLNEKNKESALKNVVQSGGHRQFEVDVEEFSIIPGAPFVYWIPIEIRSLYNEEVFDNEELGRGTACGLGTLDDFRFIRLNWEVGGLSIDWPTYFHGGVFSRFYDCFPLVVNWKRNGVEVKTFVEQKVGSVSRKVQGQSRYFHPGFVFPRRTKAFSPKLMPGGGIFSTAGQAGFLPLEQLPAGVALLSSSICATLLTVSQGTTSQDEGGTNPQFEVGQVKRLPWPLIPKRQQNRLEELAYRAWSLKRTMDSVSEISHAFLLPSALRNRLDEFEPSAIEAELASIQDEIDAIALKLYGLSGADCEEVQSIEDILREETLAVDDDVDANMIVSIDSVDRGLLSWAVGVAFGRFDWRFATGERQAPGEPDPFDPLPASSPGMVPDGSEPYHHHLGILVDDEGHTHDLPGLIDHVLETVDAPSKQGVRGWLRKEFFPFHLQRYSKSRRKAPIYWPLSTSSATYTLWLYYPELSNQSLFSALNDFIEPKQNSVRDELDSLRAKGDGRSRQEEKELERLEDLDQELADLRDALLDIAPGYRPNQVDGVQIAAAPLWPLFRHKPWQKVLKDTWKQLEKGDFDWAHLAMNYWPNRVMRKCHDDRSLAIAHGVEDRLWEEVEVPVIRRGKDTGETTLEWQPKDLSESELDALIKRTIEERGLQSEFR